MREVCAPLACSAYSRQLKPHLNREPRIMSDCNCGGSSRVAGLTPARPGKLGRCKFCIYASLMLGTAGWVAYSQVMRDPQLKLLGYAILSGALTGTLLFAAHVGAMLIRKVHTLAPSLNPK
jgi:hypothetical protein